MESYVVEVQNPSLIRSKGHFNFQNKVKIVKRYFDKKKIHRICLEFEGNFFKWKF
jgi:hypothetical protein